MDIATLGFTNWRRLLPVVEATRAKAAPDAWGSLKTIYGAQLAAGCGDSRCKAFSRFSSMAGSRCPKRRASA